MNQSESDFAYISIGTCIVILLIVILIIYYLCTNQREKKQLFDGGPPASPGHSFSYTFLISVDQASPTFDTRTTMIRLDLLDNHNQYMTNLSIPCFLFKFNATHSEALALEKSADGPTFIKPPPPPPPPLPPPLPPPPLPQAAGATAPAVGKAIISDKDKQQAAIMAHHRTLSQQYEKWASSPVKTTLTFSLIRRNPLYNLSSLRITHDCFTAGAYITFKHIIIRDETTRQSGKVDLKNEIIRAIHICPPSGSQVFSFQ